MKSVQAHTQPVKGGYLPHILGQIGDAKISRDAAWDGYAAARLDSVSRRIENRQNTIAGVFNFGAFALFQRGADDGVVAT